MAYDLEAIANELTETALGNSFHGNALYVAKDIPELTADERWVIKRWLNGSQWRHDWRDLQGVANKLKALAKERSGACV